MSTVKQIYDIVNDVAKQSMGDSVVTVVDTASFISMGEAILSSSTDTDKFTKTLVDRIGKTVLSVRNYMNANNGAMVRDTFEFGCILQKIYVDMPDAKQNNAWEIAESGYTPSYAPVIKPTVKQKLFNKISTWEIDVTIPDYMLRTAFTNETAMATFIDAIFVSLENRMQLAFEGVGDLTRAHFIAERINSSSGITAINLLDEYNTLFNTSLTVNACLTNVEFLRWASMQISIWAKRMTRMSKLFNSEEYARFTPVDKMQLTLLDQFDSATKSYLQSDTYHNDLVKIFGDNFDTVPYWQGAGTSYDFAETSKIDVKLDADTTVEQTGIIGLLYDIEAMGTTLNERRSTTERNNKDEYTNYYNKANMGYFVDPSEQGICFYVAEV